MSKPRFYWYYTAEAKIRRYYKLKEMDSRQAKIYVDAIENVLDRTRQKPDGDLRVRAVEMLYLKHTHTYEGAAIALHVSPRTVQRWANSFVNDVGIEAGE